MGAYFHMPQNIIKNKKYLIFNIDFNIYYML